MRCAMELQMTAVVRAEEKARAEAVQKQIAKQKLVAKTIQFCEELGKELEKMADNGYQPMTSFVLSDWGRRMVETRCDYVDARLSYRQKEEVDLDTVKKWFAQYCFKVTEHKMYGWVYGAGECSLWRVTIKPDAECLK